MLEELDDSQSAVSKVLSAVRGCSGKKSRVDYFGAFWFKLYFFLNDHQMTITSIGDSIHQ
jgi:hypothetical protein